MTKILTRVDAWLPDDSQARTATGGIAKKSRRCGKESGSSQEGPGVYEGNLGEEDEGN